MLLNSLNFRLPQNMSDPRNLSAAIMLVTGFTILCDWLGSDEKFFPPSCHIGLEEYLPICRRQASNVVEWAGLTSPTISTVSPGFGTIFNKLRPPRPIQISTHTGFPTNTVTPTPTPQVTSITYTYDGDGRDLCTPEPRSGERGNLMKSVLGDVATFYIGKHYEKKVQGSQQNERKHYSAGANRIAMLAPQGCSTSLRKNVKLD